MIIRTQHYPFPLPLSFFECWSSITVYFITVKFYHQPMAGWEPLAENPACGREEVVIHTHGSCLMSLCGPHHTSSLGLLANSWVPFTQPVKPMYCLQTFLQCGSVLSGVHTGTLKVLINMVCIFCAMSMGNKMNNAHANDASAPADGLLLQIKNK